MRFGEMIYSLRKAKGFTLRQLAAQVDVGFHYLSKVENQKLDFGDFPSDALICRLAVALDADVDELLLPCLRDLSPRCHLQFANSHC